MDVNVNNVTAEKVLVGGLDVGQQLAEIHAAVVVPKKATATVSPFWTWVQTIGFVTQSAHLFSAWAITLTACRYLPWWGAGIGFLAFTSFKELFLDRDWWGEGHGSPDWLDWLFNVAGIVIALSIFTWG